MVSQTPATFLFWQINHEFYNARHESAKLLEQGRCCD